MFNLLINIDSRYIVSKQKLHIILSLLEVNANSLIKMNCLKLWGSFIEAFCMQYLPENLSTYIYSIKIEILFSKTDAYILLCYYVYIYLINVFIYYICYFAIVFYTV